MIIAKAFQKIDITEKSFFLEYFANQVDFIATFNQIECILYVCLLSLQPYQLKRRLKMPRTATIQARIDPEIKLKAQGILKKLHISMSEAISMYLTQVTLQKGIPFDLKIPNELTAETIRKSERGEEIHKVNTIDELFKELES